MLNPLKSLLSERANNKSTGVYSACTAHPIVISAVLRKAKETNTLAVIESTANQVNQFGGYTNIKPAEFSAFVIEIAQKHNFPLERLILGGDHLGPLLWVTDEPATAMKKSCELVRQYVLAGYTKIHLDTSMSLLGDHPEDPSHISVLAERSALLCQVAEEAFSDYMQSHPDAIRPVYIIGSEVPIPGGSLEGEETHVTSPVALNKTITTFKQAFAERNLHKAWENVIAVVVETGVEFSDKTIYAYRSEAFQQLKQLLVSYPGLCFEGHSTDYQTSKSLKDMVEDGIAILKVGPALTFALREGLYLLELIEQNLNGRKYPLSHVSEVIELEMYKNPDNWQKHYHGSIRDIELALKYSFSDRSRYYLNAKDVIQSIKLLKHNIDSTEIPLSLISQFMYPQYIKIRSGQLKSCFEDLLYDRISTYLDDYLTAIGDYSDSVVAV